MDRQELREPRHLDHRAALCRQSCQRKRFPLVSPVNKKLHQCPHSRRIEERHAAQIKDQMSRWLWPQGLHKIVNGLKAKLAVEPHYNLIAAGSWLLF